MKIISIIVTYNAVQWIEKCIESLVNSSVCNEIYVIDNNSKDETLKLIRDKFPQVHIYETGENLGFGKANNLGLKIATEEKYDYAFLLNQDAWVNTNTIDRLIVAHEQHPDYGITVPLQMNGEGNLIDHQFTTFTISNNRKLLTDVFNCLEKKIYEVDFANAACWLLPVSVINNIGGFDPLFPHYGEDNDYINRLKKQGYKVGLDLSTRVFHDREMRSTKKEIPKVINEIYIRELVELKNTDKLENPKAYFLSKSVKALLKYCSSGFNFYYLSKLKAYFKVYKKYKTIIQHKELELVKAKHYL